MAPCPATHSAPRDGTRRNEAECNGIGTGQELRPKYATRKGFRRIVRVGSIPGATTSFAARKGSIVGNGEPSRPVPNQFGSAATSDATLGQPFPAASGAGPRGGARARPGRAGPRRQARAPRYLLSMADVGRNAARARATPRSSTQLRPSPVLCLLSVSRPRRRRCTGRTGTTVRA